MHDLTAPAPAIDCTFSFRLNFADCRTAADIVYSGTDRLKILFRLKHEGGTHITSDDIPWDLDFLLAGRCDDFGAKVTVGAKAKEGA